MNNSDVIYTPVYKGDRYMYHECSECKYQVRMTESIYHLYFGESFKYCPNCGGTVARFANIPVFLEEFNYAIFDKLDEMSKEFQDIVDYYCKVTLTADEFKEMIDKCKFAMVLKENGGRSISIAVEYVSKAGLRKWSHWEVSKLKERVERKESMKALKGGAE